MSGDRWRWLDRIVPVPPPPPDDKTPDIGTHVPFVEVAVKGPGGYQPADGRPEPATPPPGSAGVSPDLMVEQLQAKVSRLRSLLRQVEWVGDWTGEDIGPACPVCKWVKPSHKPGCELAAELGQ